MNRPTRNVDRDGSSRSARDFFVISRDALAYLTSSILHSLPKLGLWLLKGRESLRREDTYLIARLSNLGWVLRECRPTRKLQISIYGSWWVSTSCEQRPLGSRARGAQNYYLTVPLLCSNYQRNSRLLPVNRL